MPAREEIVGRPSVPLPSGKDHLRKGEAERHVRAVWTAKATHDQQLRIMHDKPPSKLDDFIVMYAKGKFNNNPKTMAEWTYNLVVTLRENSQDTDCDLFFKLEFVSLHIL